MKPVQVFAALLIGGALFMVIGAFSNSWITMSEDRFSMSLGLREMEACGGDEGCKTRSHSSLIEKDEDDEDISDRRKAEHEKVKSMIFRGNIAFFGGLAAALAVIGFAMALLVKGKRVVPIPVLLVVGNIFLIITFLFIAAIPEVGPKASNGFAFYLYALGSTAIIGAAIWALSSRALADAIATHPGRQASAGSGTPNGGMQQPGMQQGYGQQGGYGQPQQPGYGQQPGAQQSGAQPPAAQQSGAQPQACPRCSSPAVYVAQYQRYYCQRCQAYL